MTRTEAVAADVAARIWTDVLKARGDYAGWMEDKTAAAALILDALLAHSEEPFPPEVEPIYREIARLAEVGDTKGLKEAMARARKEHPYFLADAQSEEPLRTRIERLEELHQQSLADPSGLGTKQAYINGLEEELERALAARPAEDGLREAIRDLADHFGNVPGLITTGRLIADRLLETMRAYPDAAQAYKEAAAQR